MIIVIGNGKGGVGKTTTAVNMAVCLAKDKHDVALVDIDQRPQSANWAAKRKQQGDIPKIAIHRASGDVFDFLTDLGKRYTHVVVDAGGFDSAELRSSILAANILVVPTKPSQLDAWALPDMNKLISDAKKFNKLLKVFSLITVVDPNPKVKEVADIEAVILEQPTLINLIPTRIYDRKIYRDAIIEGKGVIEMPKNKAQIDASNETLAIYERIFT